MIYCRPVWWWQTWLLFFYVYVEKAKRAEFHGNKKYTAFEPATYVRCLCKRTLESKKPKRKKKIEVKVLQAINVILNSRREMLPDFSREIPKTVKNLFFALISKYGLTEALIFQTHRLDCYTAWAIYLLHNKKNLNQLKIYRLKTFSKRHRAFHVNVSYSLTNDFSFRKNYFAIHWQLN